MIRRAREPDPMEQIIDHGNRNNGLLSPQSHSESHSEGGNTAMCIIALILAVMAFSLVAGRFIFDHDSKQDMIRFIESKAKEAAAVPTVKASESSIKSDLCLHNFQTVVGELKKHNIVDIPLN